MTSLLIVENFPPNGLGKKIVAEKVNMFESSERLKRIRNDIILRDYLSINSWDQPLKVWLLSRRDSSMSKQCHSAVYLLSKLFSYPYNSMCSKCGLVINNISEHLLLRIHCTKNEHKRRNLWKRLIEQFGLDKFNRLLECQPREQLVLLLSGLEHILDNNSEVELCLTIVVNCFHFMSISNYSETSLLC